MEYTKLHVNAKMEAAIGKVWTYYTDPNHITKWNFANDDWQCPSATNDMQQGGKYFARMEAKDGSFGFDFEAIIEYVEINRQFSYIMSDGRRADILFTNDDNTTAVTITFDADTENTLELQEAGWQAILNNFKAYVITN